MSFYHDDIMQLSISVFSVLMLLSGAHAQGNVADCSGQGNRFPGPRDTNGLCFDSWLNSAGETKRYPEDYEKPNYFEILRCPSINKRIFLSNSIPDHDVAMYRNRAQICEIAYAVELPLDPVFDLSIPKSEVPIRGMIAMARNGVPTFGAQEAFGDNAVEVTSGNIYDARYWYGHPSQSNVWHVHNPNMGEESITSEDFLGYAMDGFPIYGPLDDDDVDQLDSCNGLLSSDGSYRYHVRTLNQVDEDADYCNGDSPITNWNYVLGCYSGDISKTVVNDWNATGYLDSLPSDCEVEMSSDNPTPPTDPPISNPEPPARPNIIIMQPDDLAFLDEWTPPPNKPTDPDSEDRFPPSGLPNIDSLRVNGLQMMQAYAASPVCGTSRYSTITGKYPSRAASIREEDTNDGPSMVTIPTTKLIDTDEQKDCSEENLAVAFNDAGYSTAMFGKWHLSKFTPETYTYQNGVDAVKSCGFDTVGGLYIENLRGYGYFDDGTFSHNMEWVTWEAISFLNETSKSHDPFFMYFNPTVPHGNSDVEASLSDFTCQQTADPNFVWDSDPFIKGMSENGCEAYRQTVLDRAQGVYDNLGKIWLDDAVGALLHALEDNGQLENTVFLFQEDHGVEVKGVVYEAGVRIPQFVHYPAGIEPGTKFEGLVSTVDVAATMMDYAGIDTAPYQLDGKSWKAAIGNILLESYWKNDRCIFFENEQDRGARCGCYKYIDIYDTQSKTYQRGGNAGLTVSTDGLLFDLCDGGDDYVTDNYSNREIDNRKSAESGKAAELQDVLGCHLERTDTQNIPGFSMCGAIAPPTPVASPVVSPPTPVADPTRRPTETPTAFPTAAQCSDSPFKALVGQRERSCRWIKNKGYCGQKQYWKHCRDTCEKCDRCYDSSQQMPVDINGWEYMRYCSFVRKAARNWYCDDSDIAKHCPKACGLCS